MRCSPDPPEVLRRAHPARQQRVRPAVSRIEVPMPQMGESIAEGTVSKWLKAPGDAVDRDEPILEISTDKVDAEIPSPSAGVLAEILVPEGETVEVGTVVAYIEEGAGAGAAPGADGKSSRSGGERAMASPPLDTPPEPPPSAEPVAHRASADEAPADPECTATSEERLRTRSTPVVRRIAQEAGVDIARVPGTGHQGRVTKQDILSFIESEMAERAAAAVAAPQPAAPAVAPPARVAAAAASAPAPVAPPAAPSPNCGCGSR